MSMEGDCHEVEVAPDLELLVTLVWAWREFVMSFIHNFTASSYLIWRWAKIPRRKLPPHLVWESHEFGYDIDP
jgi:hypothetical protein